MDIKAKKKEYDARKYFESWHRSTSEFSDRVTISPTFSLLGTKYHYNIVENLIIGFFYKRNIPSPLNILDIGSGSGHWIDFYLETFQADSCTGIEISDPCVNKLKEKYKEQANIDIKLRDISKSDLKLKKKYQIISAIGVMFHIVNDSNWRQAMTNLAEVLDDQGILIVGGEFGEFTKDVQFHKIDEFNSWQERNDAWEKFNNTESEIVLVNKRIRSLSHWMECLAESGLEVIDLLKSSKKDDIKTPQNNLLIIRKKRIK